MESLKITNEDRRSRTYTKSGKSPKKVWMYVDRRSGRPKIGWLTGWSFNRDLVVAGSNRVRQENHAKKEEKTRLMEDITNYVTDREFCKSVWLVSRLWPCRCQHWVVEQDRNTWTGFKAARLCGLVWRCCLIKNGEYCRYYYHYVWRKVWQTD